MIELSQLLGKFEKLLSDGELGKEAVQKALKDAAGLEIPKEKINIRSGTIYLDIKPLYKNEILIKKDLVLAKLKEYRAPASENIR
jgi:hypothetical protein